MGAKIRVPCQGKMDRSSDRDRTKQQVARRAEIATEAQDGRTRFNFAQCRWECVSQTEERRMERKGAGIGIDSDWKKDCSETGHLPHRRGTRKPSRIA